MKLNVLRLLVLSSAWTFIIFNAYAYDDHDFQVWNSESEEFKINKETKFTLEEEFRWADNANIFYYHHYDAGISRNLNKYWSVGGGYRHVLEDKKVGGVTKFRVENEPYITATFSTDLKGFKFDSRSRMEYRHFVYQPDSWRYRNKFTVKLPWKFTKLEIQPYLSDEIYVGFGGTNQFNQNRFSSGLGMNFTKNIKAEIYYLLQSSRDKKNRWGDINVLGTKLKFSF